VWSGVLTTLSLTFMRIPIHTAVALGMLPYYDNGPLQITHLLLVFAKGEPQRLCPSLVFYRRILKPLDHSFKYADKRDSDPLLDPFFEMLSWRSSPLPSLCSYISWYIDNHSFSTLSILEALSPDFNSHQISGFVLDKPDS
jgi:hypothetical protein